MVFFVCFVGVFNHMQIEVTLLSKPVYICDMLTSRHVEVVFSLCLIQ